MATNLVGTKKVYIDRAEKLFGSAEEKPDLRERNAPLGPSDPSERSQRLQH
jgi:hypothetical protein